MYRTTDVERFADMVEKYQIEYVYVGPTERLYFPQSGIAKFASPEGTFLEVVYENDDVTLYRVVGRDGAA